MARKIKLAEPSLRDKLSENVLRAIEADFAANGVAAIEALRQKSPENCEIAARLIATTEPKPEGYLDCKSKEEIAIKLLESAGGYREALTPDMIEAALKLNDDFVMGLEKILEGH